MVVVKTNPKIYQIISGWGELGCRARPVPIGTTSTNFGTTSTKIDFLVLDAPDFFFENEILKFNFLGNKNDLNKLKKAW